MRILQALWAGFNRIYESLHLGSVADPTCIHLRDSSLKCSWTTGAKFLDPRTTHLSVNLAHIGVGSTRNLFPPLIFVLPSTIDPPTMLLLLYLVHALHTSGRPVPGDGLASRAAAESCDDINNCRKLFDIIWGCLVTIFACTWVSVHPNVPPPNQSWLALFWRRLKMMLIAIIAPELMVGFAARQFFTARSFAKGESRARTDSSSAWVDLCRGAGHHPIVIQEQFDAVPAYLKDIRAVDEEDIKDKSKGDALSKGVALVQGLWFTTQCIARVHQRLPVSELEVTTLAFAIVNILIYVLWWEKPLDVQRPILVGPQQELSVTDPDADDQSSALLRSSTEKLPKEDATLWRGSFWNGVWGALSGYYRKDYKPTSYTSVPSFYATASTDHRDKNNGAFSIECLVGTIFGGIHCAAWSADFPSIEEMWMWRWSAVAVATIPGIVAATSVSYLSDIQDSTMDTISTYTCYLALTFYSIARLFLIILPLIALRSPPPGALTDVNWSVYIPHL
ncbi:hypothetical protein C8R43DRAFT_1235942 [Mycena crocata]|nr:hypothetical protein C8R43DRAFT_1235942 [Mycena crocata]